MNLQNVPNPSDEEIDKNGAKMEYRLDAYHGLITINIFEVFREMDDEAKARLLEDGGWWSLVTPYMLHDLVEGFATTTFNSTQFELRKQILTAPIFHAILQQFLEGVISELGYKLQIEARYQKDYWALRSAVTEYGRQHGLTAIENLPWKVAQTEHESSIPHSGWVGDFVTEFMSAFFASNPECALPDDPEED